MAQEKIFNAFDYFETLGRQNKMAKENGFKTGRCSGIGGMQDMMTDFRKQAKYILVDDTTSQNTFSNGVGYFRKDVYTIFIVAPYRIDNMAERETTLNLCRCIFRQMHSRIIHDRDAMVYGDSLEYLQVDRIYSNELPQYFMSGVTGLYFMVENEEPIDLTYDPEQWIEG